MRGEMGLMGRMVAMKEMKRVVGRDKMKRMVLMMMMMRVWSCSSPSFLTYKYTGTKRPRGLRALGDSHRVGRKKECLFYLVEENFPIILKTPL